MVMGEGVDGEAEVEVGGCGNLQRKGDVEAAIGVGGLGGVGLREVDVVGE